MKARLERWFLTAPLPGWWGACALLILFATHDPFAQGLAAAGLVWWGVYILKEWDRQETEARTRDYPTPTRPKE